MLARFDIVLVAFPFTNVPNVKPRPALVICQSERHQDVLLAFISSKISGAAKSAESGDLICCKAVIWLLVNYVALR
jgi:hypothetical protein